jgi:hypothetical protein
MDCYHCGSTEHISRECEVMPGKPPSNDPVEATWCGDCDKRTRLVDHGDHMSRCRRCWRTRSLTLGKPQSTMLEQHTRCGGCNQVIYVWDQLPCGQHQDLRLAEAPRLCVMVPLACVTVLR